MEAGFAAASFAGGSLVFLSAALSSANKRPGTAIVQSNVATSSQETLLSFLNARISLSYRLLTNDALPRATNRHLISRHDFGLPLDASAPLRRLSCCAFFFDGGTYSRGTLQKQRRIMPSVTV
jgi:hypothetical protein